MAKSFVYNSGSAEDSKKDDELWFDYGVFIDGTLNNQENTRLRRKYRNEDEHSILTKDKKEKDLEIEKEDYESLTKEGLLRIPDHIDSLEFDAKEYKAYLLGIYRDDMDKAGTDNSYSNDDTNVTRMWKCCDEDYRIYVQGMGTADQEYDSQDGFAFGAGQTGIRSRVRFACKTIAERIFDLKKGENAPKIVTKITLDVFGFSRGAASARNFVHEVNAKKPYKPHEIKIPVENAFYKVTTKKALGDADGLEINPKRLINGKMPRLGHLGYCLLEKGVVTKEELENLKVIIRFVGVYDTVSSYYEIGALGAYNLKEKAADDEKYTKLAKEAWSTHFTDDEKELGLQDLGDVTKFQKLVHFTAKDEHRQNFALTRINEIPNKAIEKNFPGVHCDIGGAYENEEEEYIDEIGTNTADGKYDSIYDYAESFFHAKGLEALQQDLITQHWYKTHELKIVREKEGLQWIERGFENIKTPFYLKLTGTRVIRKEYSYIPLHFMEEFCRDTTMLQFFNRETVKDYPLKNSFLEKVKKSLHEYVFDDASEWEFVSDAQLLKEKQEREEIDKERAIAKEIDEQQEIALPGISIIDPNDEIVKIELPEKKFNSLNTQKAIRKLRQEYLHWSSNRDWFGMQPTDDRKRIEYPKK